MKKSKTRFILVSVFILLFLLINYISLKGDYLEFKELGENYLNVFLVNLKYKVIIFLIIFAFIYLLIYITNKLIKKSLKPFFDSESKQMPKLPNKSIAFVLAIFISVLMTNVLLEKILLFTSDASFGITDKVFNLDISYYMFIEPLIQTVLRYLIWIIIGLSLYMALVHIIVFNRCFKSVDGKMIRNSLMVKILLKNVIFVIIIIAVQTLLNTTNILFNTMMTIKDKVGSSNNIDIIGAGHTDINIQRWGYTIFAFIMVFAVIKAVNGFKQNNLNKVLKNLAIVPSYLVVLFIVIAGYNLIFVKQNELDKQKKYLNYNIENTKNAYKISVEEENLNYNGTITKDLINENENIIDNIRILNEDIILKTLDNNQTETGYYSYRNANISKLNLNGEFKLVYISPREISNKFRSYNNKTYEQTHGMGEIVVSATDTDQEGNISYLQKSITGNDDVLGIKQEKIYFGLETNDTIATNTKNKQEYDYTDEDGKEHTSNYEGNAGLQLNFLDRLVLGIKTGDIKLGFSSEVTNESKILINRNILKRAKKAMPYLVYDNNPYLVVTDDGNLVWVIDAYTISNKYPYSEYTSIEHDGIREKINYIRNSVKVLINAYDGTMKFYIVDQTDPIIMAYYKNTYGDLFEDLNSSIPEDISKQFIYPKYLYEIQAQLLKTYHNVKADVLYRTDDLWNYAKYNNTNINSSSGTVLTPYYTMFKNNNIGLIQIYTPNAKQNIISYLVGINENGNNTLKLYKFSQDSNVLGTMQLEKQIEQDDLISKEIESLNQVGSKISKDMVVIPIDNTLLYVESIYQTMLNVKDPVPTLKRIVVASGNKIAIGNNLNEALTNLLSKDATNIEIEDTDNINGLIDAIVKANNNLKESTGNKDWELIGSDMEKLQSLIDSLEQKKKEQDENEKEEKQNKSNNSVINDNTIIENNVLQ